MALIYDLKISSSSSNENIGFVKDSIDPDNLIITNKVREIIGYTNYSDYFTDKRMIMPPLDEQIFKYLKCYSGSYVESYDDVEYTIIITFFTLKNPELITEKVIENKSITQIFAMSTLITNNFINLNYHQYRQEKFIKDIEKNGILDLSFVQPEYINTALWTTQKNNISWMIKNYFSENKSRFSNNIYISLPNNLILDYTASTKSDSAVNKFVEHTDIPEQKISGVVICDEPSMGKTLQIITFASFMYINHNVKTLIVYPDQLEGHWQKQAQLHLSDKINYKKFLTLLSFTKFGNIIRFEEINENEILVIDEYHETFDPKKSQNAKAYENSIRFPIKFKVALTSTPFITPDSLLKIIQYLCSKTFYNTSIAYVPEIQDSFIKYFKKNLIKNSINEILIPDVNIVNIEIEFNRYEQDIYDTITLQNKHTHNTQNVQHAQNTQHTNQNRLYELKLCCDVYLMFDSNVNSMRTPKDLKNDVIALFESQLYHEQFELDELESQFDNIKSNKNNFKHNYEYEQRLKHFEHLINTQKDSVNVKKNTVSYYKNAIENIEKIIKNDEIVNEDDVCAICLSTHTEPIAFLKKCGHYFCKICIDQLQGSALKCPICRNDINGNILYVTSTAEITLGSKFVQLIQQLRNTTEKFIIFTQFKKIIENIKLTLDKYNISNITFKELFKSNFKNDSRVIIMSSDENASGIDELTSISNMIIFEPFLDYSYGNQIEKQLIGRIRRVGQSKDKVNVFRFYVKNTVEEQIYKK